MKRLIVTIMSLCLVSVIISCGGSSNNSNNNDNGNVGETEIEYNGTQTEAKIDLDAYGLDKEFLDHYRSHDIADFGDLIQSFPSPVEVSSIIQDMKVPYSESLLFDAGKCDNFETSFKKSLGLGVFCADLGYLNVYNKTGDVINYLVAIRKLTEALRLAQFFDFPTLKRIATNNNNLDSLLILSTMSYYNMDTYLRESNRADVSAMMVTGVWTESLYLASQVYKKKENKRMRDHIASQKYILDELMAVLVHYMGNNVDNVKLVSAFKELSKAYEPVSIETKEGEDKVELVDGQAVTTQGTYTVITVSDEQMTQIVKAVETLRKKITEAL
ncbi:MAG: hypothetical protein II075_06920 [Bacteroidales bacterium]|nr:hypothetical protein [Bacteroidales bacterium]